MHWPSITRQRFVAESFLQRPVRVRRLPCPRRSVGKLDLPWRRRGLMHQLRPRLNRVNGTGVTLPPVASVRGVGWASSGAVPTWLPAEQAFGGEGTGAGWREETTVPPTAKLDWAGSCKVPKAPHRSTATPWRWTVGSECAERGPETPLPFHASGASSSPRRLTGQKWAPQEWDATNWSFIYDSELCKQKPRSMIVGFSAFLHIKIPTTLKKKKSSLHYRPRLKNQNSI